MKKIPTMIPVVAVALIDSHDRILMQQRRANRAHGGLWEFPGGKVEPAETARFALRRELEEELGIAVDPAALLPLSFADSPDQPHVVMLYSCRTWSGEPRCLDAEQLTWVAPTDLLSLAMPPLDVPLARVLVECLKR